MKRSMQIIPLIALIVVLIIGASAPVAGATEPSKGVAKENAITAAKLREKAELLMENQITPPGMVETAEAGIRGWDTVVLGKDKTFYNADAGNCDAGHNWFVTGIWDSDYYTSSRKAEAATVIGSAGWGSAWAWANIGKFFYVSGDGSRATNLRISGDYEGLLEVLGSANCAVEIEFVLYDYTASSDTRTTILNKSKSLAGLTSYDSSFSRTLPVVLQSGHYYCAYLQVKTSGGYVGAGECSSDFGTQDWDPGYTRYSYIKVDF